MVYVALLRGINVGGKAKVEMSRLKQTFEDLGFTDVKTYINSGNVIFKSGAKPSVDTLETAIEKDFGFRVPVVVRSLAEVEKLLASFPDNWVNDADMKCDVMFLWPSIDSPDIMKQIPYKPDMEDVLYVPGAVVWRVDRSNVNRGQMLKIIGTDVYKQMTVRNRNTVRKLYELMKDA